MKKNGLGKKMYDAIVAGGGPAGSTAAKIVAEKGYDVLLIERRENDPQSTCAGGIGHHHIENGNIEFPDTVICEEIDSVRINSPNESFLIKTEDVEYYTGNNPLGYVIDRKKFDTRLLKEAEDSGVDVRYGVSYKGKINYSSRNIVVVVTNEEDVSANYLILATGAQPRQDNSVCYQEVVETERDVVIDLFFYPEMLPEGYFWLFQEGESRYRLGAGTTAEYGISPKKKVQEFKEMKGINGKVHRREGGLVGTGEVLDSPSSNVLYVGDRKNLASSLTGAGIYPAIVSGKLAGEYVADEDDTFYDERVESELGDWEEKQDYGRNIVGSFSKEEMDRLLEIMQDYEVKSATPTEEFENLLPHVMKKDPKLFFKLTKRVLQG